MTTALMVMACAVVAPPAHGPPDDPTWNEAERGCVQAWYATRESLTELYEDAGRSVPPWPGVDAALSLCRELGVDADTAACLDGPWYAEHVEMCRARFAAHPAVRVRWNGMFEEVM